MPLLIGVGYTGVNPNEAMLEETTAAAVETRHPPCAAPRLTLSPSLQSPEHPPKPHLVVRVGVTGHRPKALRAAGADEKTLQGSVRNVLTRIEAAAEEIFELNADIYAGRGPMALISPLAEGSDRLVARTALDMGYQLQCPLPFPRDQYETTFDEEESAAESIEDFENLLACADQYGSALELDGRLESADQAYEAVGRVVLRQCDVLICIWDGKSPKPGGTGQIAREAVKQKIPTVLIDPRPPHAARLLGKVSEAGEVEGCEDLELLANQLEGVIALPSEREVDALQEFYQEKQPKRRMAILFRFFCRAFVWDWPIPSFKVNSFQEGSSKEWRAPWQSLPGYDYIVDAQVEKFRLPFDWADVLADIYADRYRSSFVATYFIGACAVLAAFLGSYKEEWHRGFYIEFLLITGILALIWWNRRERWHDRWIDYRLLAEGLRQMQVLQPFARVTPTFEVPAFLGEDSPGATWFNWYFRAIIREAGLIKSKVEADYLKVCRKVLHGAVASQVDYHGKKRLQLHHLHRRLRWLTLGLFGATLIACVLHLLPYGKSIELPLTICAIVLPAFGAAIEGINHQSEFERLTRRSRAIKSRLEALASRIEREGEKLSFRQLGRMAESFCEIQILEQTDWRSAFISKEINPT